MIKVMIVENDPLAMQPFTMFINNSNRYKLVHTLESAIHAGSYCASNDVDLILMDICTNQGASGLNVSAKIK